MKLDTKAMTLMAMFAAMQIVLEFLTKFTPSMPQGGNVAFSLVAIFLCSYLLGPLYGAVVGLVCCGLHFALGLATFYGPYSVAFDYVIPMVLCGVAAIVPSIKHFPVGIVVAMVLKTISHLIAGWYQFKTPLKGNLTYNVPYNVGTLVACVILFMILYPRLEKVLKMKEL